MHRATTAAARMRILAALLLLSVPCAAAEDYGISSVTMTIAGGGHLTRSALTEIKNAILKSGKRQTYCNMYNDNPTLLVDGLALYLNPDSGQENGDCDETKSDFQTLIVATDNHYYQVEFITPGIRIHFEKSAEADGLSDYVRMVDALVGRVLAKVRTPGPPGP
ncbi:MAG: hypothetical protein H0X38_03380 [Planctomycetes bacterium]|nr:hypothetical protein [Planctomycetota bacterium]